MLNIFLNKIPNIKEYPGSYFIAAFICIILCIYNIKLYYLIPFLFTCSLSLCIYKNNKINICKNNKYLENQNKLQNIKEHNNKIIFIESWLCSISDDEIKNIKLLYSKSKNNTVEIKFSEKKPNKIFYIISDIQQHYFKYNLNNNINNELIYYIEDNNNLMINILKIQQNNNIYKLEFIDTDFINILKKEIEQS